MHRFTSCLRQAPRRFPPGPPYRDVSQGVRGQSHVFGVLQRTTRQEKASTRPDGKKKTYPWHSTHAVSLPTSYICTLLPAVTLTKHGTYPTAVTRMRTRRNEAAGTLEVLLKGVPTWTALYFCYPVPRVCKRKQDAGEYQRCTAHVSGL